MTEVLAHTIADATKVSGLGRTSIYELIGSRKLDARKAGNRTLITASSLRAYLTSLPAAEIGAGQRKTAA